MVEMSEIWNLLIFHQNVINSLIFQQIFNFTKFFLQIYISKKWGFTKWDREEYEGMRESGKFFGIFPPNI